MGSNAEIQEHIKGVDWMCGPTICFSSAEGV